MVTNSNKRIARNTLFLYFRMGIVLIISLFTTRVILHALGVEDYGIYNVVSGFVSMFTFLNASMSNGIQRFYNYSIGKKNSYTFTDVYNVSILIQLLLAIVLMLGAESIGMWYIYNKMIIPVERFDSALWIFQFSIISLIIVVMQIPYSAAIMANEKMDYYAYVSIFDVLAKLGIAYIITIVESDRLILYGFLNLLMTLISFFLYFNYAKKNFKDLIFIPKTRISLLKPILYFSSWNILGSFSYMIKSQGVNMLLNMFFGPVVNAARGISSMVMSALQGFQSNIVIAFRPQLVQSYATEDYQRVQLLFFTLSRVSYMLLAFLSIPVILEIKFILRLWLGDVIPSYTVPFTILILINMVISSLNTPISQIVHATGKMRNYQMGTCIVICSILPLSWFFLRLGFDATYVYWVSLFMTIINQVVCVYLLKRIFDYSIREYIKKVVKPCLLFSIIAPILPYIITIIESASFIRLILTTIVSFVSSGYAAYYLVLNNKERQLIIDFINKKIKRE